jgi:hypothetical protein
MPLPEGVRRNRSTGAREGPKSFSPGVEKLELRSERGARCRAFVEPGEGDERV